MTILGVISSLFQPLKTYFQTRRSPGAIHFKLSQELRHNNVNLRNLRSNLKSGPYKCENESVWFIKNLQVSPHPILSSKMYEKQCKRPLENLTSSENEALAELYDKYAEIEGLINILRNMDINEEEQSDTERAENSWSDLMYQIDVVLRYSDPLSRGVPFVKHSISV